MSNFFIYGGFALMLAGSLFGFYVAYKGYKRTPWSKVRRISFHGDFQRGKVSPVMERLTRIWVVVMLLGFLITGIGIIIGLN